MRDERIYQMNESNFRRVMLLLRQFEFLNTRQLAFEQILSSGWKMRLIALFSFESFIRLVDNRQKELLAACKEEEKKARMMPKIIAVSGNGHG